MNLLVKIGLGKLLLTLLVLTLSSTPLAQEKMAVERPGLPFPSEDEIFGWIKDITEITDQHKEFRRSGTPGDVAVRNYIMDKLKSFGVEDVHEDKFQFTNVTYDNWELKVNNQVIPSFFLKSSSFTDKQGLTADLVYVGKTLSPDLDVKGKIAVVEMPPVILKTKAIAEMAEWTYDPEGYFGGDNELFAPNISLNHPTIYYELQTRGAAGYILILSGYRTGTNKLYPDVGQSIEHDGIPGLIIGKMDGEKLVSEIKDSAQPLSATMTIQGTVNERAESANIVGMVKGVSDDVIIINTHHDSGWTGAVEDASGISMVLALAKYWASFPYQFRIKTVYFVIEANHWDWEYPKGSWHFIRNNKEIIDRTAAVLGLEHISQTVDVVDGKYVPTGEPEPPILFSPVNEELREIGKKAIENNDLRRTWIPPMSGESLMIPAQTRAYHLTGIPVFQTITSPEYLYLEDDTLDKVAKDRLVPTGKAFLEILLGLQYIPKNRFTPR
ncbi:M28 family peptidase [Microbulbifer agarilyticus]